METIVNNLIKAIGWGILHSLWQGAMIYYTLFIVLISWPKMTSRLKHNLSFGALLLMFITFVVTFLSMFELPSNLFTKIEFNQITYQNFIQFNRMTNFKTENYFPFVVGVYLIGIILQLFVLILSYFKLKSLKKVSTLAVPTEWKTIFELIITQLKINKTVQFYLSPKVNVPLVIGFLKPVVLFPIGLATHLDQKQVEAILIHELSHIRRNDYLINLVKTSIETLLFFNPFVWLITKLINVERENACDDLVVELTKKPIQYAQLLLKLEMIKNNNKPNLSVAATGKKQYLLQRIKRLTEMKTNYSNTKQQIFFLTLTLATFLSISWIMPTKIEGNEKTNRSILFHENELSASDFSLTKLKTDTIKPAAKKKPIIFQAKEKGKSFYAKENLADTAKAKLESMNTQVNSTEWKERVQKMEAKAKLMEEKFNTPEWKERVQKMEAKAKVMEEKFNTPEWKERVQKMETKAKVIEKKFNSPEWKERVQKMEAKAKVMEEKINTPEWKERVQKMEAKAKEMEEKINTPEWKERVQKMETKAKEMEKKGVEKKKSNKNQAQ
jgi:beta-lactamase regulating signal transducer with metallopeptidase domain